MSRTAHARSRYLSTLQLYFEEEIMGEAYFIGLKNIFAKRHEREKLDLLAQVERYAAEAIRPLLVKYGLVPRPDDVLKSLGEAECAEHGRFGWRDFMTHMSVRYPGYLDDFDALEKMAPQDDLAPLQVLTAHEVAAIEFANAELAGAADSVEPLKRYLGTGVGS